MSGLFNFTSAAPNSGTTSTAPAPGGSLFGNNGGSGSNTPALTFGSTAAKPAAASTPNSGGSLFGQKPAEAPKPGGLFGAAGMQNAGAGGTGLFGSSPASAGGLFGSKPAATTTNTATSTAPASGALFGSGSASSTPGGLFGSKPADKPATGGLFGGGTSSATPAAGGLFGGQQQTSAPATGSTPTTAAPATSLFGAKPDATATPAKSLFGNMSSTTPAGAPPAADSAKPAGSGLFPAAQTSTTAGSLFGQKDSKPESSQPSTTQPSTTATAGSSLFNKAPASGGLFGAKPATSAAPASGGLFGNSSANPSSTPATQPASTSTSTSTSTGNSLFGGKPQAPATSAPAGGSLFGNTSATTTTAAAPATTTTSAAPAPSLFGAKTDSAAPKPASGGLFGAANTTTATSQPAATTTAPTTAAGTTSAPAAAGGSLFGKPATTPAATTSNAAPAGASLFGKPATETTAKEAAKPAAQNGTATTHGASTSGPTSQMARLKNKTMEDIVTRWASDLSKYQKEFKDQATVVSTWDRQLVDNGEKIQKLYLDTYEAERASNEIERQLATVESQQEELEAWLDRYESEVQEMFAKQIGPGEQLTGPDQERERTYKLAEKLTQQLDEKSRDLSKMVKEINDISGTLSKGAKPEDPLSQIVRVLNGHLTQLQWIDANASALQAKVAAAHKSSSNLGSNLNVADSDVAEGFYRSYMGRR